MVDTADTESRRPHRCARESRSPAPGRGGGAGAGGPATHFAGAHAALRIFHSTVCPVSTVAWSPFIGGNTSCRRRCCRAKPCSQSGWCLCRCHREPLLPASSFWLASGGVPEGNFSCLSSKQPPSTNSDSDSRRRAWSSFCLTRSW